ncbi:Iron-sulfur cluster assembly protein CyaY [Buchnera aphidicola (Cinara cuneomaculata)]|uniref:Iron-sulfur cluster assembly protein CyaY n=1 Tax=Buchnera aphidicola (Cinara cuneomaculata) TaxID=1660040 RepID=A0A451CYH4_9GAMM|nr:iron donor protein CyaY [Buchnera aphidicola]VFP78402.1 Iron-sulfur cluster assembly protein CyaY [Buchnera aphidicola (Cinara cuneomaculata)]
MHDISFHKKFKKTLLIIDDILNKCDEKIDIDYFIFDNMLSIAFNNKKKIILTSQVYLKQLWIATSIQGYHLTYSKYTWVCIRTKKHISSILEEEFFIQTNYIINFNLLKKIK